VALAGAYLVIVALVAADVTADAASGTTLPHLVTELTVIGIALAGAVALWRDARASRRRAHRALHDVAQVRAEAARWREEAREALDGLSLALDRQFDRWGLTPAEREVALYLLNGLGMRDVAAARGTSERTARKQALAVYAKAGLGGRAELAAFFLEALIVGKVKPELVADEAAPTADAAG
jgi:DNA-binding CsgD family transcriptional regulator